ncbi:glycosyltransferase family 87 protein [Paraliomyxa miuraensis]|uniref:glycosyltransferase family 87 protein n=1 Tax=Paraliomyxa miuraensis TaxID=376150 RepID=UPI002256671E|nr:glycosyltransferase family 87 protein [Paraliomyxa miuraensis]
MILVLGLVAFVVHLWLTDVNDYDHAAYWNAAQEVFKEGKDPYTDANEVRSTDEFVYSPPALLFFYPSSLLSESGSGLLMWVVNAVLALVLLAGLPRDLSSIATSPRFWPYATLYIALFGGIFCTIAFGQVNIVLAFFMWLFWRTLRQPGSSVLGGSSFIVGCALFKPHYAVLGLATLGRPRPRFWLGIGLTLTCSLLATVLLLPDGLLTSWLSNIVRPITPMSVAHNLPAGEEIPVGAPWNRSLASLGSRLLVPNRHVRPVLDAPDLAAPLVTIAVIGVLAASIATVVVSLRAGRAHADDHARARRTDHELSILALAAFLVLPTSWQHHTMFILPACLVALRDMVLAERTTRATRVLTVVLLLAIMLTGLTYERAFLGGVLFEHVFPTFMTLAVVALWAMFLAESWRMRAKPEPHHEIDT